MLSSVIAAGGLNTESSLMELRPGEAVALHNVEIDQSGDYVTMRGIERFDGRQEPNKASYLIIGMWAIAGIVVGDLIVASPSGGYATVVGVDGANPADRRIAVINIGGPAITLSDTIVGNAIKSLPANIGARGYQAHKQYLSNAAEILRLPITTVPGINVVRGIAIYKNEVYAFRDHSDGTTARMYKSTSGGWVEVASSGFILPAGRYEFRVHNFTASAGTEKLFIVNGVNKALMFDGVTFTQLSTGMTTDAPSSIEVLPSDVLLLGYDSGSLMFGKPNDPTDFSAGTGGEIGCSDKIIGMALQPDERVAVFCENSIRMIAGKTKLSITMSVFTDSTGAKPGSIANIGDSVFISKAGLTRLGRVQSFGSFAMTALDKKFKTAIQDTVNFSVAVRGKNQYRVFSQRGFVGVTMNGSEVVGAFTGSYPVEMKCGISGFINSEEYVLLGGADGFVYRADVGASHAGEEFTRIARFAHNHLGSPQQRKKFKRLTVNADCERHEEIKVFAELDYSSGDAPRQKLSGINVGGNECYFGTAVFGESVFGAAADAINQIYLSGVGRAIAPAMIVDSAMADPVRIGGYIIETEARAKHR